MDCPFCMPEAILESDLSYVKWDKFPVSLGHSLIIPKRHVETWFDLSPAEQVDALNLLTAIKLRIEKEYSPSGYNIGINCGESAGQTVFHAHVHIIPRYKGDVPGEFVVQATIGN